LWCWDLRSATIIPIENNLWWGPAWWDHSNASVISFPINILSMVGGVNLNLVGIVLNNSYISIWSSWKWILEMITNAIVNHIVANNFSWLKIINRWELNILSTSSDNVCGSNWNWGRWNASGTAINQNVLRESRELSCWDWDVLWSSNNCWNLRSWGLW